MAVYPEFKSTTVADRLLKASSGDKSYEHTQRLFSSISFFVFSAETNRGDGEEYYRAIDDLIKSSCKIVDQSEVFKSYEGADSNIDQILENNYFWHKGGLPGQGERQYLSRNIRDAFSHGLFELRGMDKDIDRVVLRNRKELGQPFRFLMCIAVNDLMSILDGVVAFEASKATRITSSQEAFPD